MIFADQLSLAAFYALLGFNSLALLRCMKGLGVDGRIPSLTGSVYLIGFIGAVAIGLPREHFVPVGPILFVTALGLSVWFVFSRFGTALRGSLSLSAVVAFQGFRVPLELILHHWSRMGTIPETMTWTGQNFDILSGLLALVFYRLVDRRPTLAWVPTLVGLGLLLNVLRVVVLSSPLPFSWPLEHPLQLIMYFPYALIVPLCVAPALGAHLLVVRMLLSAKSLPKQ